VASNGNIYRYVGGPQVWQQVNGGLSNVSVASDGDVWGVASNGNIYHYLGGGQWQQVSGAFVQVSAGSALNIWGVNSVGNIFVSAW
jgi:hypothetical protein